MKIVIRSSSLLFSILGIIFQAPVSKVKKKATEERSTSTGDGSSSDDPKRAT